HVGQEIAIVGQLGADRQIDDPESLSAEEVEQPLHRGHDHAFDAIESVRTERLLALVLQRAAESLQARCARVLEVDDDQREALGVEGEAWIELERVIRNHSAQQPGRLRTAESMRRVSSRPSTGLPRSLPRSAMTLPRSNVITGQPDTGQPSQGL